MSDMGGKRSQEFTDVYQALTVAADLLAHAPETMSQPGSGVDHTMHRPSIVIDGKLTQPYSQSDCAHLGLGKSRAATLPL